MRPGRVWTSRVPAIESRPGASGAAQSLRSYAQSGEATDGLFLRNLTRIAQMKEKNNVHSD